MSDIYEIKKKKTSFTVKIDDMSVVFTPLGAGSDLTFSQKQRRATFLNKKIETLQESAKTQDDFDAIEKTMAEYDKLDLEVQETVRQMFKGAAGDEKRVNEWLDSTSIFILLGYIEEIGKQINGTSDGEPEAA